MNVDCDKQEERVRLTLVAGFPFSKLPFRADSMGARQPELQIRMVPGERGWISTNTLFRPRPHRAQPIRMKLSNGTTVTFEVSNEEDR